jgi:alpha-L-fucosidase
MLGKTAQLTLTMVLASAVGLAAPGSSPSTPGGESDGQAFAYRHSTAELEELRGADLVERARADWKELEAVNAAGPYEPTWESLERHPVPEWYVDAKLGIFYDWGLYSVPGYDEKEWKKARYPDWYLHRMYTTLKGYHARTWGADFERDDFVPLFTGEDFDAKEVVDLVVDSGARYLVPFSKHHDGFCLWKSSYTDRNVVDLNPGFDVTEALVRECRKRDLPHGFYFSVEEYEYPVVRDDGSVGLRLWNERMADGADTRIVEGEILADLAPRFGRRISGKIPVPDFVADYLVPQAKEFIDRYQPDILWFDGEWDRLSDYYRMREPTSTTAPRDGRRSS